MTRFLKVLEIAIEELSSMFVSHLMEVRNKSKDIVKNF